MWLVVLTRKETGVGSVRIIVNLREKFYRKEFTVDLENICNLLASAWILIVVES